MVWLAFWSLLQLRFDDSFQSKSIELSKMCEHFFQKQQLFFFLISISISNRISNLIKTLKRITFLFHSFNKFFWIFSSSFWLLEIFQYFSVKYGIERTTTTEHVNSTLNTLCLTDWRSLSFNVSDRYFSPLSDTFRSLSFSSIADSLLLSSFLLDLFCLFFRFFFSIRRYFS